jgi:sugar O-acyltransferase (sialic acid O-acetyltransferase NeuD family)
MGLRQIIVIGACDHAKHIISIAKLAGQTVQAIYDDDGSLWGETIAGAVVRGPVSQGIHAGLPAVMAFDDPCRRQALAAQLDLRWAVVVHPRAIIDRHVAIGPGSIVMDGVVVQPDARIGCHTIIEGRATVAHDCVVGDFVRLRPGVQLAGAVKVGANSCLEAGAAVIPNVRLGSWSYVAAGSVVIRDTADYSRVAGVPARPVVAPTAALADAIVDIRRPLPT